MYYPRYPLDASADRDNINIWEVPQYALRKIVSISKAAHLSNHFTDVPPPSPNVRTPAVPAAPSAARVAGSVGGSVLARPPTSQQLLAPQPMRSLALFRSPVIVPQSHDQLHFRKSTPKLLAQVTSVHHGAGRRGGNANDIGFAPLHKINHLAGQGRNRDCLHNAVPRLQYLREHHGSDFIRLAASGQGEDAKPR